MGEVSDWSTTAAGNANVAGLEWTADTERNQVAPQMREMMAQIRRWCGEVGTGQFANVIAFGATGDGTTDDTAAFHAAIATGRPVYIPLPAVSFRVNLVLTAGNVWLHGASWRSTVLRPFDATKPVIKIDGDAAGAIISNFKFENFSIQGNSWLGTGDGIQIFNTADTRGCDFMDWQNLFISGCRYGVNIQGRTIWNTFKQVNSSFNFEGWHIETDQGVNGLIFDQCQGSYNRRHGFFARRTGSPLPGPFLLWSFNLPTFEANGLDTAQPFACGAYFQNVSNLTLDNPSIEANGLGITESYGIRIGGEVSRGVVIRNGWLVDSKYPLYMDAGQMSGRVSNLVTNPTGATVAVTVGGLWTDGNGKMIVDERTISGGTVSYLVDVNGNYQAEAIDYVASPTATLDLRWRDKVQINTGGGTVALTAINNTLPGDEFVIVAAGANAVTVASGLMLNATLVTIAANTGQRFVTLGAPNAGKFVAL